MSEAESKRQLVECVLMLERAGIIDYNGHCSVRVGDNRILINIGSCPRSQLTPDDICAIDLDGKLIDGNGNPPLECHLHCAIYRARTDVNAVVHAHPKWTTFLTMVGHSYQPVTPRVHSFSRCRYSTPPIQSIPARWRIAWRPRSATGRPC